MRASRRSSGARSTCRTRRSSNCCGIAVLSEVTSYVDFLFLDEPVHDEVSWSKAMKAGAAELLRDVRDELATAEWEAEPLKAVLVAVGEKHGLTLGKAQAPVLVAVMGRTVGLPLFESLEVLGRDQVLTPALERLAAE